MSKQYAHLHAMAKTSVKFQNDWPKTVGGVALTSQLLTNGRMDGSQHAYIGPPCIGPKEYMTSHVVSVFDIQHIFVPLVVSYNPETL